MEDIMFRKVLALLLSFVMLFSIGAVATARDDNQVEGCLFDEVIPAEIQIAMENQEAALASYFKLIEYFEKDKFGLPIYPKEYAGEYIDENNQLVVQITEAFDDEKLLEFLYNDNKIVVKYVDFSYEELISCESTADELYESGIRVVSDGVDIKENKYKISVQKEDFKKVFSMFSQTRDSRCPIVFEEGECAIATTALYGGDRIFNEDTGDYKSIGISGTYNGSKAILTCGHGNEKIGGNSSRYPYIKNYSNRIGQVVYQQANTNTSNTGVNSLGDFAIVKVTSSDTISNYVQPGIRITGTYSSVPVGTTIYKYGTTTGYSWGTVTATNLRVSYSYNYTSYVVRGLYSMNMTNDSGTSAVDGGDSGGPVWRKDGSSYQLQGIVTAKINGTNTMYSTPIAYAQNQGFTPKTN